MPTKVGESPKDPLAEQLPDWSPVPDPAARGARWKAALLRVGGAALGIALLLWLGHPRAAVLLVVVIVAVMGASARWPAFERRLGRFEKAIQQGAGRVLGVVLMTLVHLLVFTPLWLLLRLFGIDTVRRGQSDLDPTFWRPSLAAPGRTLYQRPFGYDRDRPTGRRSRGGRLVTVLGIVTAVVLVDVGLGVTIDRLTKDPKPGGDSLLTFPDVPAGGGEASQQVRREIIDAASQARYDPFLGWRVADFDGRYVNVEDEVRRTYVPRQAAAADAVSVFFFGGSTMFGAFQSDGHTIASEFARLAEADGIHVKVVNYGQTAYVAEQEEFLFEQLVGSGKKPDLAVFYDGFNELMSQFALGPHREPTHLEAQAIQDRLLRGGKQEEPSASTSLYRAWADTSAVHRLGRSMGIFTQRDETGAPLRSPWAGAQADRVEEKARNAVVIHARDVDRAERLGRSYGVRTAFFWQPSIYTKQVVEGEEALERSQGADPEAWRTASRVARSRLAPPVVDISDSLDGLKEPVMYDFVHTNELGARTVAAAIYEPLRDGLRRLLQAKSG